MLVMTLLVKDEELLLKNNLEFHLAQGVDKIIVTDNGSTDNTPYILKHFEDAGLIEVIHEPSRAYHQKKFVNRMVRLAIEKYNAQWIINADGDEFFYSNTENLKDALPVDGHPNILFCQWCMSLPRAGQKWQDIDHFCLVDNSKSIHTAQGFITVSGGNHKVYLKHIHTPSLTDDITLYHLNSRDFASFKGKLENKFNHCVHTRNKKLPPTMKKWYQAICLQDEKSAREYYDEMIENTYHNVTSKGTMVQDSRFADFIKKTNDWSFRQ